MITEDQLTTVFFGDLPITVFRDIADRHEVKPGQQVDHPTGLALLTETTTRLRALETQP